MADSRTGTKYHLVSVSQTSVMLELVSDHDVPVNLVLVTFVPVILVTLMSLAQGAKSSVVNNQSIRLNSDNSQSQWISHSQCNHSYSSL
eukprot:6483153-Amphidinium_carterae.3